MLRVVLKAIIKAVSLAAPLFEFVFSRSRSGKPLVWKKLQDEDDRGSGTVAYIADSHRDTHVFYLVAQEPGDSTPTLFIKNRDDELLGMRPDCASFGEAIQMAEEIESGVESSPSK